jgi:uncharacterized repeat protein (TIGR01451 family)
MAVDDRHFVATTRWKLARACGVALVLVFAAAIVLGSTRSANALPAACVQAGASVTCSYSSLFRDSLIVPRGVSTVHVVAVGGRGGAGPHSVGGFGARITGDFDVNAGDPLYVLVGGNGGAWSFNGLNGGFNGGGHGELDSGGGGGASEVRTSAVDANSQIIVAAGGGGGGGARTFAIAGGDGGIAGLRGGGGADAPLVPGREGGTGGAGGQPGTSSAGGTGGPGGLSGGSIADGCEGHPGLAGVGGNGAFIPNSFCQNGGGGGGGGVYGGGSGGGGGIENDPDLTSGGGGGGGGGSSLVPAGGTATTDATGQPRIVISYTAPLVVTPSTVSFGDQPLGSTSGVTTMTLSNTGTAPVFTTGVSVSGANATDFIVSADSCSGHTVAPGATCTAGVRFAPTDVGARTASVSFADDATDSPQVVAVSGNGTTLADLAVSITAPASAKTAAQITDVVRVLNNGPSAGGNVVMTAAIPAGTKFVAVSATRGTCTAPSAGSTSGTIRCAFGDFASGAVALNSISLKLVLAKGGNIVLVAQAASLAAGTIQPTPDPNLSNNLSSASTLVGK